MQTEGKTKRDERPTSGLGFTRSPSEEDPRRDARLLDALARIAPGTDLRAGIDDIIRSREGALIVIGDPAALSFLYSGGIRLDQPFTPQLLYELAKMDGAIIVNSALTRLAYANVQLMPDPTIASNETGTRHRTAERVAKQTGTLVVSISQQRETVTVFIGNIRYQLEAIADVLAKTNQALATLDTYRTRLEQALTRLTALEFQNAVVLDDVLVVLQRAELTTRMAEEIERDCVELGTEGRLIRLQLVELVGYPRSTNTLDHGVSPRGFRVLSHIPRIPENVIDRVVSRLAGLDAIVRASQSDLETVEGVGPARARETREVGLYEVGDKVVYPHHGAGTVVKKEEREVLGQQREYLTIKILHNDMTVNVPCENAEAVGLRKVIDEQMVEVVVKALTGGGTAMPKNWNRRFKHNRDKMKTGDILELAEVVRNLSLRDHEKGLSTGEKQMFVKAKKILASELMYAKGMDADQAAAWLDEVLATVGNGKKKSTRAKAGAAA